MKHAIALFALTVVLPVVAFARDVTTHLAVDDMDCPACPPAVTKALKQIPGVKEVRVSVSDQSATVVADEKVSSSALVDAIGKAGFSAQVATEK